jgi:hypothetical protein
LVINPLTVILPHDFYEPDVAAVFFSHFFEDRRKHLARRALVRKIVDNHRLLAGFNQLYQLFPVDIFNLITHLDSSYFDAMATAAFGK